MNIIKGVIAVGVLLAVIVGAALYFFGNPFIVDGARLVLKDDGFYPREVIVDVGETVTFVNKGSHAFWPASDNHPLHNLYTEFDTGRPLQSGDTWEFVFEKEGVWTFHDHLRPYFRGRVVVGDVDPTATCLDNVDSLSTGDKQACWEQVLMDTLEEEGAKKSFALFTDLYGSDPAFSEQVGCHWMAHKLGEAEYGRYLRHRNLSKVQFPPETVYCGYGYYHGFLEHFLRDDPDYDIADNFCAELIENLEEEVPRIRLNCYHAVGHGFVPEPDDIEVWGDPRDMVQPAIVACRNIEEQDALTECLQGAFNVIADWSWNDQFGLYIDEDNPLAVCELFDEYDEASACYYEVSMRLNPLANDSIVKAYRQFVSKIPDEFIAGTVLNSVAASALGQRITDTDFSDLVYECRQVPGFLQTDCMKGLTGAFIAHGEPNNEHIKAIEFCSQDFLNHSEKDVCFWNIIRTFKGAYTKDKVADICTRVEEPYQKYCSYDIVYE